MTARATIGFIAAMALSTAASAELRVELRPFATVHAPQVVLGDVAYIRGDELNAVRRLVMLPLGSAPRPGTDARLDRDRLLRWARSRLGSLASQAHWTGADEVSISSSEAPGLPGGAHTRTERNAVPAVARGEWVVLRVRDGAIELESRAEALQDAQIGEPVRVRSAGAAASVVARVVAPRRVEMER